MTNHFVSGNHVLNDDFRCVTPYIMCMYVNTYLNALKYVYTLIHLHSTSFRSLSSFVFLIINIFFIQIYSCSSYDLTFAIQETQTHTHTFIYRQISALTHTHFAFVCSISVCLLLFLFCVLFRVSFFDQRQPYQR